MDTNKCITIDETSMTDGSKSQSGMRRCRDHTEVTSSGSGKRTKFDWRDNQDNGVQPDNQSPSDQVHVNSPAHASCDCVSSPCFNDGSRLDLKDELHFEDETSMPRDHGFRTETSSSGEICLDSNKMESITVMEKKPAPLQAVTLHRKPSATAAKTPTTAEIDEFFSVLEKEEQKRLSEKYNFDFVNEVPLDGRYQWVRLKP